MNIAVNTQLLIAGKLEGIGWFSYELLKRITRQNPQHQFFFIFDRPWSEEFIFSDNITPLTTAIPSRHPILWYLRFNHGIPRLLRKHKIDLFFSPDGFNVPAQFNSHLVIHDLNFEHFPENLPWKYRAIVRKNFRKYAGNANRLATVSEYSRQDIVQTYGISPDKIDVVYNAASEAFKPLNDETQQQVREQYTQGSPYFLFVGALNPRKNIHRLLQAFEQFCHQASHHQPAKLVIAGATMFSDGFYQDFYEQMQHKDKVVFTGRMQRDDLAQLTASALALVLPSTFEGFGVPLVEAMHCEVPIITAQATAMPEIAANAALYVDPYSVDSITRALQIIHADAPLRQQLIAHGRQQRLNFSWDQSAQKLWNSIALTLPPK